MPTDDQESLPPREEEIVSGSRTGENQVVIEDDNVKEFVGELEARIEALETTVSSKIKRCLTSISLLSC